MPETLYHVSLGDLARSPGHAPGQPLVETAPDDEAPYDPPVRVTPMSPASAIVALGQLASARPGRKGAARAAAVFQLLTVFPGPLSAILTAVHALL